MCGDGAEREAADVDVVSNVAPDSADAPAEHFDLSTGTKETAAPVPSVNFLSAPVGVFAPAPQPLSLLLQENKGKVQAGLLQVSALEQGTTTPAAQKASAAPTAAASRPTSRPVVLGERERVTTRPPATAAGSASPSSNSPEQTTSSDDELTAEEQSRNSVVPVLQTGLDCRCDACRTTHRFPSELLPQLPAGSRLKCAPPTAASPSPTATSTPECRNTNAFSVLATRVGENVNAERYCFHECKPVQGWSQTPQGASCVSLTQGEVRQLTAAVLRPAPSPELAARSSRLHDPAALQLLATKRVGTELSSSASSNGSGDDVVAHAQKVAADTAADAAKSSAAAHAKVESRSGQDVDWSAGAGVVLAQMVHAAETEANEAVEAAGAAVKTMDESCDEARASAVAAGDAAIASLATEEAAAAAKAAAYNARVASTPNAKAKVAMEKAAKPFFDQMTQAQGTARDYVTVADKKAGDAAVAEGEARELENQANAANARGERAVAESLIGQAKSKWAAGQRLAKKAEELRSQAQDINKLVPQYQHAGTVAGALAAQAANPNFVAPPHILPPPPPDPMASWAGPDPMADSGGARRENGGGVAAETAWPRWGFSE
eukprot:CAMPEP_0178987626 /NCGR_PEP_ID=MMETSP0795-20121207/3364_1 /TAXON_ID=88552 /ORGANISM="Amoebophrya sp., Strain Ameob2" /LENGTH=606 /DNA_ID=CAMNT_0020678819 /DNA_START=148 /DNA_END=1970 /DNA_ORIENTATION=+